MRGRGTWTSCNPPPKLASISCGRFELELTQQAMTPRSGSTQAALWGRRAADWAEIQESTVRPLYEVVFDRLDVGLGTRLLDAGCGSGLALAIASGRGASVAG